MTSTSLIKTYKKVLDLFTPNEKLQGAILLFFILIAAFLDMLGVASILPFVSLLMNHDLVETNKFLIYLYEVFNNFGGTGIKQFLFILGIGVFIILIFSLIFRSFVVYFQTHFSLMREYSISKRLVEGYLRQPYIWFLDRNSVSFRVNILSEVSTVINDLILPFMNLISQSALTCALLILIIFIDPKLAIIGALFLVISYGVIFLIIKNTVYRMGSERTKANQDRYSILAETFGSIKVLKLGNLEQTYINRFAKSAKIFASNISKGKVIAHTPRYLIEGVAFGGLMILILTQMLLDNQIQNIIPVIALYAFAGYRMIPALHNIYHSVTHINFSSKALDMIHQDMMNFKYFEKTLNTTSVLPLTKSIELSNVNFSYNNNKQIVLKNINLTIPAFSKVGIVGLTGSGKTTMVNIIMGLLDPNEGSLSIDGNIINASNKKSWQKCIGYMPQQIYLSDDSIINNIAFGVEVKDINYQAIEQAAKIANLHDFIINELPNGYNTTVGERGVRFSGGQQQQIGIARALYHKPQILVLDEATSALDNYNEQIIMEALKNIANKITIIIIAHRLSTVKNCDVVFVLDKGELKATGTYEQLNQSSREFKKISNYLKEIYDIKK
jgi:ATP-binding cassette, subfamily B, bacterial PglK